MARRKVIQVTCDRCKKVEAQGLDENSHMRDDTSKELTATFHGQSIEYEDLCRRCRSAVENYFKCLAREVGKDEPSPNKKSSGFLGMGKKVG